MAQHHAVEPTRPPASPGDRAELAADVDEAIAVVVGQLGRERAGTDPGRVRLRDPDDTIDVARTEPGAGARPARRRVGGRDVRIGAVVEIEERRLGALEEKMGAGRQGIVEEADRVGDVRRQAGGEGVERGDDLVDVERLGAVIGELAILGDRPGTHLLAEASRIEHIAGADADAAGLVGVRRSDALERGADLVVAAQRLGDGVVGLVPREDEVGAAGRPGAGRTRCHGR